MEGPEGMAEEGHGDGRPHMSRSLGPQHKKKGGRLKAGPGRSYCRTTARE